MNPIQQPLLDYAGECPSCGHRQVSVQEVEEEFEYGLGSEQISVSALVPVMTCCHCGFSFTDETGEVRRHDAICAKLGVLKPLEIRFMRECNGMSQADLAALSGIGKASLSRWERGALIQNEANDSLLRLLAFPENLKRLGAIRHAATAPNVVPIGAKFRSISGEEEGALRDSASLFRLYA